MDATIISIACVQVEYVVRIEVWHDGYLFHKSCMYCDDYAIVLKNRTQTEDILELKKGGDVIAQIQLSGTTENITVYLRDTYEKIYADDIYTRGVSQ